jgi:hypothetical protein
MFSRIRKRFTYANVAMTLALVFAMSGGAYAAKHYLITSTKQISPKVLKALKGANGKSGAAGLAGLAGAQGAQGPQGAAGAKGENGAPGAKGENGAPGAKGENGTTGFTETLPSKKTLKGEWNADGSAMPGAEKTHFRSSVSYALPLVAGPATHYIRVEEGEGEHLEATVVKEGKCKGTVEEPEAAPGNLCVFAKSEENTIKEVETSPGVFFKYPVVCKRETEECFTGGEGEGSRFGFGIEALSKESGEMVFAAGTWAVTAK